MLTTEGGKAQVFRNVCDTSQKNLYPRALQQLELRSGVWEVKESGGVTLEVICLKSRSKPRSYQKRGQRKTKLDKRQMWNLKGLHL
jgi:hypothetical protein